MAGAKTVAAVPSCRSGNQPLPDANMPDHTDLLKALRQITQAIDLHSKHLLKESGLTSPQLLVLQAVSVHGREKPSEIARVVNPSQGTITSIVDRLARAGLADRERNAGDKRVIEVVVTDAGRSRLADAPEPLQADRLDAAPILEIGDLSPDEPAGAT